MRKDEWLTLGVMVVALAIVLKTMFDYSIDKTIITVCAFVVGYLLMSILTKK